MGPYVVVKPELGRKGAEIHIKRAGRVRYRPPESFPVGHPVRKAPLIAQRFIYTGKWPSNFRVVTAQMVIGAPIAEPQFQHQPGHSGDPLRDAIQKVALGRQAPDHAVQSAHRRFTPLIGRTMRKSPGESAP